MIIAAVQSIIKLMFIKMSSKYYSFIVIIILMNYFEPVSAQPTLEWQVNMDYNGDSEVPLELIPDSEGNSYVVINSLHNFYEQNFLYSRVGPSGTIDWTVEWATANEYEFVEDFILESNANGYLCGNRLTEGLVVRVNESGEILWNDTSGLDCKSIASLNFGEIYTAFYDDAVVLVKYDSSGAKNFVVRNDTSIDGNNAYPSKLLVDPDGNAFIIGYGVKDGDVDVFIKKFNSTGEFVWDIRYSPSNDWDLPNYAVIDDSSNLYLLCEVGQGNQGSALAKFDSSGNLLWDKIIESPSAGNNGLILHSNGNITRAGHGYINSKTQFYLAQYNSSGDLLWLEYTDSASTRRSGAIALGPDESTYFACSVYEDYMGADIISLAKYSSEGQLLWETRYDDPNNKWQAPVQLAIDSGSIFVLAWTFNDASANDVLVLKYSVSTGISSFNAITRNIKVTPNPLHDYTTIQFSPFNPSIKTILELYDLSGKLFRSFNVTGQSSKISREGLANGMYLLQFKQNNQLIGTAKIVVQ